MSTNNGKQRIFVAGYRSAANCSFVPIPDRQPNGHERRQWEAMQSFGFAQDSSLWIADGRTQGL